MIKNVKLIETPHDAKWSLEQLRDSIGRTFVGTVDCGVCHNNGYALFYITQAGVTVLNKKKKGGYVAGGFWMFSDSNCKFYISRWVDIEIEEVKAK